MTRDELEEELDCYIECGDGWLPLIEELVGMVTRVDQIKEKYGMLTIYAEGADALVAKLGIQSRHTCEVCGELGAVRKDSYWIKTLCEEHK